MTRLLHDRYFAYADDRAWDLATGEHVTIRELPAREPEAGPIDGSFIEVLDHGRDGEPRWIVLEPPSGQSSLVAARRAAVQARARGFVPIAVDVYLRLRSLLGEEIRHRTLMLILGAGANLDMGRLALVDAAEQSPRPHLLVSFRTSKVRSALSGLVVKEARLAYGARIATPGQGEETMPRPASRPGGTTAALPEDVQRQLVRAERWSELVREGRHAAAGRLLRDVAAALVRRQAPAMAGAVLTTLGRLVLERGRVADADAIFGEAATHGQSAKDEHLWLTARIWQAVARTDANQLTAAESICRAALASGGLAGADQVRAETALARTLLWQQRIDEAAARELQVESGDDEVDAVAASMAIRILLAQGDVFGAGQRARAALARAESTGASLSRVVALTAHFRVLIESGDLVLAEARLADVREAARAARAPLRHVRARVLWADALRRVGRTRELDRELRRLSRLRTASPPLLRAAIDARLRQEVPVAARDRVVVGVPSLAASLVAMARDEERDRQAVSRVLEFVLEALKASRIDLCSADAGPETTIVSVGSGLATAIGPRVLDAGIVIDTRSAASGGELGVPVRLGPRLVAAIVARWPADRVAPAQSREVLDLVAAVTAPRVEAMRHAAREEAAASTSIPELVGSSPVMADVRRAVTRAATAPFAVLIEGESGSGKELVARALHHLSARRERRFCDLNCAALPDELLESELFGHARGAFTGAIVDRPGLVEEADGGTLFLDEVADLSPRAQAKLLRVLQQQEVRRLGATVSRKVDVRVVSAANRDLRREAEEGRFRLDLLYRLDVVRIRVPPLRERPEDVPLLAMHFWQGASARVGTKAVLTHGVLTALSRYAWPGNVRELQNVIAGLAVAAPARGQVNPSLLPQAVLGAAVALSARLADAREQFERRFIEVALARAGGRRARAARDLGLSRQGLLKMMERLGL